MGRGRGRRENVARALGNDGVLRQAVAVPVLAARGPAAVGGRAALVRDVLGECHEPVTLGEVIRLSSARSPEWVASVGDFAAQVRYNLQILRKRGLVRHDGDLWALADQVAPTAPPAAPVVAFPAPRPAVEEAVAQNSWRPAVTGVLRSMGRAATLDELYGRFREQSPDLVGRTQNWKNIFRYYLRELAKQNVAATYGAGLWGLAGLAAPRAASPWAQAVLDALQACGGQATITQLYEATRIPPGSAAKNPRASIRYTIQILRDKGLVANPQHDLWTLPGVAVNPGGAIRERRAPAVRAPQRVRPVGGPRIAPIAIDRQGRGGTERRDPTVSRGRRSGATTTGAATPKITPRRIVVDAPESESGGLNQSYLRQARDRGLLTQEEEIALAQAIESGRDAGALMKRHQAALEAGQREGQLDDEEFARMTSLVEQGEAARRSLAEANVLLVQKEARIREKQRGDLTLDDLVQAGCVGLMAAVDKFNWRKGFKFSTYATWWIRQGIGREIEKNSRSMRLPVHTQQQIREYRNCLGTLATRLGRQPTDEEAAIELGWSLEALSSVRRAMNPLVSLDQPLTSDDEGGDASLQDVVPDAKAAPFEELEQRFLRDDIRRAFEAAQLSREERECLIYRFGFDRTAGGARRTYEDVAEMLNISRDTVRARIENALKRLSSPKAARHLEGWLTPSSTARAGGVV